MGIYGCLPLLDGWTWRYIYDEKPRLIREGKFITVLRIIGKGWFFGANFAVDNPDAEMVVEYDATKQSVTPKSLYILGITEPNPAGIPWVSKFDPTTPLYVCNICPANPWAFSRIITAKISAPTDSQVTLLTYSYLVLHIRDPEKLKETYQELITKG